MCNKIEIKRFYHEQDRMICRYRSLANEIPIPLVHRVIVWLSNYKICQSRFVKKQICEEANRLIDR